MCPPPIVGLNVCSTFGLVAGGGLGGFTVYDHFFSCAGGGGDGAPTIEGEGSTAVYGDGGMQGAEEYIIRNEGQGRSVLCFDSRMYGGVE